VPAPEPSVLGRRPIVVRLGETLPVAPILRVATATRTDQCSAAYRLTVLMAFEELVHVLEFFF
jgi:hypothetical protein